MADKDFDAERKKRKGHTFTLGGQKFRTHPGMSVTFVMRDKNEDYAPLERTIEFLRALIVAEDRERFVKLMSTTDVYLDPQDLLDVSNWLMEVISGRPTKSPASSGNGAGRTGTTSKAKPSEAAGGAGKK